MDPTPNEQQLDELIEAQAQGEPITVVPTDPTTPATTDAELDPRLNKGGGDTGWPGF